MSQPQSSKGEERPQGQAYEGPAEPDRPYSSTQPMTDPHKPTGHSSQDNSQQTSRAESTAILDDPHAGTSDHPRDAHPMSGALLPLHRVDSSQQDDAEPDETPSAPSTPAEGTWQRQLFDKLREVQEERARDESYGLPISDRDHAREGGFSGDDQSEKGTGSKGSGGSSPEQDDDDDDDGLMFRMDL